MTFGIGAITLALWWLPELFACFSLKVVLVASFYIYLNVSAPKDPKSNVVRSISPLDRNIKYFGVADREFPPFHTY